MSYVPSFLKDRTFPEILIFGGGLVFFALVLSLLLFA
jgi:hypothetical protein